MFSAPAEERSHAPAGYETGAQQAAPLHESSVTTLLSRSSTLTSQTAPEGSWGDRKAPGVLPHIAIIIICP